MFQTLSPRHDGLVVKNGSKMRSRTARYPGTGVAELDEQVVVVECGAHGPGSSPSIAETALSMRFVHTWFNSLGYAGIFGSVRSNSLTTLTPEPIFPAEHHQCAVQQFVDVDDLIRRAVELRDPLGRLHEVRDTGRGVLDLVHEELGLHGVVQPVDRALERRLVHSRGDLVVSQSVSRPASPTSARELPAARDVVVVQPVGERVLPVGGLQRAQRRGLGDLLGGVRSWISTRISSRVPLGGRGDRAKLLAASSRPAPAARRWPGPPPRPDC